MFALDTHFTSVSCLVCAWLHLEMMRGTVRKSGHAEHNQQERICLGCGVGRAQLPTIRQTGLPRLISIATFRQLF